MTLDELGFEGSSAFAASAVVAGAWLWIDSRAMPTIEHYSRPEWYLAIAPGAPCNNSSQIRASVSSKAAASQT